ncbi:hypothetical protein DFP72DRAFT_1072011 [Ephemerocybe angulata]|uniref:Uncharacterized protein n=1 Tax=Ephemerocybe angulata TaxID=980116 RepID=A0A8H6HS89_9AGAR|nr:hypothetical protein DFP72DRAFT_1072011 [Tulosesus angulatus]
MSAEYSERPFQKQRRRHKSMPTVLIAINHPLVTDLPIVNTVYVLSMKTDEKSLKDAKEFEESLGAPAGTAQEWISQGLIEVVPGDYVFLRDVTGGGNPLDDVFAAMITGPDHHSPQELGAFGQATDTVIGPSSLRSRGTTALENTGDAIKVQSQRCYALGVTVEPHTGIEAPAAAGKEASQSSSVYRDMTSAFVMAAGTLLANVTQSIPSKFRRGFEANSALSNVPRVGHDRNTVGANIQINFASVSKVSSAAEGNAVEMGHFGEAHFDRKDHYAYISTMISNPSMPRSYHPGYFHILHLGIFAALHKFTGFTFSGRRKHIGTPPTPPAGIVPREDALRVNAVFYPTAQTVNGKAIIALGSLPEKPQRKKPTKKAGNRVPAVDVPNTTIWVAPEMMDSKSSGYIPAATTRSTFIRDGGRIMSRRAHLNFVCRSILQQNCYALRQLAPDIGVSVDQAKFFESITYSSADDGSRLNVDQWPEAPDVSSVRAPRMDALDVFEKHCKAVAKVTPSVPFRTRSALEGSVGKGPGSESEKAEPQKQANRPGAAARKGPTNRRLRSAGTPLLTSGQGNLSQKRSKYGLRRSNRLLARPRQSSDIEPNPSTRGSVSNLGNEEIDQPGEWTTEEETDRPVIVAPRRKKLNGRRKASGIHTEVVPSTDSEEERQDAVTVPPNRARPAPAGPSHRTGEVENEIIPETDDDEPPTVFQAKRKSVPGNEELATLDDGIDCDVERSGNVRMHADSLSGGGPPVLESPPAKRRRQLYPILDSIYTQPGLKIDLDNFRRQHAAYVTTQSRFDKGQGIFKTLREACYALNEDPLGPSSLCHVKDMVVASNEYEALTDANEMASRLEHCELMITSSRPWTWIDVDVAQGVRKCLAKLEGAGDWLDVVIGIIKLGLVTGSDTFRFNPAAEPLLQAVSPSIYVHTNRRKGSGHGVFIPGEDKLDNAVLDCVLEIFPGWIGIDGTAEKHKRMRSWMVEAVVRELGAHVLTTAFMWQAFANFRPQLYVEDGKKLNRTITPKAELLDPFRRCLAAHPVADRTTEEGPAITIILILRSPGLNLRRRHDAALVAAHETLQRASYATELHAGVARLRSLNAARNYGTFTIMVIYHTEARLGTTSISSWPVRTRASRLRREPAAVHLIIRAIPASPRLAASSRANKPKSHHCLDCVKRHSGDIRVRSWHPMYVEIFDKSQRRRTHLQIPEIAPSRLCLVAFWIVSSIVRAELTVVVGPEYALRFPKKHASLSSPIPTYAPVVI